MEVIKDDCIRKIEAVKILQKAYTEGRIKAKDGCVSVLDDINALPKADVQLVKRSRWVPMNDGTHKAYCESCGQEQDPKTWNTHYKYCPNCGARMYGDAP